MKDMKILYAGGFHPRVPDTVSVEPSVDKTGYTIEVRDKTTGQILVSTGCTIDPLPHPWKGRNVYNTTGRKQSVGVRMEDGEGVRFWITIENDGTLADTIHLNGCKGNRRFVVNHVTLGKQKRPDAGATEITKRFKEGTAKFSFPPTTTNEKVVFTLNIQAPTTAEGVSYECNMTIYSEARPTVKDRVVARMTTY